MRTIPQPPEFLVKQPVENKNDFMSFDEQTQKKADPEPTLPPTVETYLYVEALEQRRRAETSYAEIYSQYLEVVAFNEKLLRNAGAHRRFRNKLRAIYDRARRGDQILIDTAQTARQNLVATEKALSDLQLENEALRISLSAHEEAFRNLSAKVGQAEATMDKANEQFGLLAEECDRRGQTIIDVERRNKTYSLQIEQMASAMKEMQEKFNYLRDENLLFQNQMRDAQLREAGVSALNAELTESMTKLQKQIHEIEDKLFYEREGAKKKIADLEHEVARLRETRHAEQLVEESKRTQAANLAQERRNAEKLVEKSQLSMGKSFDQDHLDKFYQRWSQIIDQLSTHSSRIDDEKAGPAPSTNPSIREQLVSERGDLDLI